MLDLSDPNDTALTRFRRRNKRKRKMRLRLFLAIAGLARLNSRPPKNPGTVNADRWRAMCKWYERNFPATEG